MNPSGIALFAGLSTLAFACGDSKKASPASEQEPPAAETAKAPAQDPAAPPANPTEDSVDEIDPAMMESDPSATDAVVAIDFKGKAPDDAPVHGKFHSAIGWTDKYGRNAIVFGISQEVKKAGTNSLLVADFLLWEGDAWNSQRQFKQSVDACEYDTALQPIVGSWSVTDLDKNGVGEASFAWHAGCRSDVSPVENKVFLVGFGADVEVAKYALRGSTRIDMAGEMLGDKEFKADEAFASAPKAFLDHAKLVWEKTSLESF